MLTRLRSLVMSNNRLTGTVPTHFGLMSNFLIVLDLSNNTLSGPVQSNIGMLSDLEFFDLSKNKLSGTLPTELGLLTSLTYMNLAYNDLTGIIPTELALLTNVGHLGLVEENKLTPNNSTCTLDISIDGCPSYIFYRDSICLDVPTTISFIYNGGDCSQSDNVMDRHVFECFDSNTNPPPSVSGVVSYIVATDVCGDVYFEGFVAVGDLYTLNEDLMLEKLSENINITIYDPKESSDPLTIVDGANILQTVLVDLSCAQPLYLLDQFGSNQVIKWTEPDGREVNIVFEDDPQRQEEASLIVSTPDNSPPIRLLELNVISNIFFGPSYNEKGLLNKTDEVYGTILQGNILELSPIQYTVNVTEWIRYTFFATIVAETIDGSDECNGSAFHECITGTPLLATKSPSAFPTITPFPS